MVRLLGNSPAGAMLFASYLFSPTLSQAPTNISPCDYYSNLHYPNTNVTLSQTAWMTQFVVNAFGGNNTVFSGSSVQGILTPSTSNGTSIHLIKYFDGSLYSINSNKGQGESVNLLDSGGIITLQSGSFAQSNTSLQYGVFSGFSKLFARVLMCSDIGSTQKTAFLQQFSLYNVHKYMALTPAELAYFIDQVGLAAMSVGLTSNEASTVKTALEKNVVYRCLPESALFDDGTAEPQSICTDASCPLAPNAQCGSYSFDNGTSPQPDSVNGVSAPTSTPSSDSDHQKTVDIAVGVAVPVGVILLALLGFIIWRQKRKMKRLESRLSVIEGAGTATAGRSVIGSDAAPSPRTQMAMLQEHPGFVSQSNRGSHIVSSHHHSDNMSPEGMPISPGFEAYKEEPATSVAPITQTAMPPLGQPINPVQPLYSAQPTQYSQPTIPPQGSPVQDTMLQQEHSPSGANYMPRSTGTIRPGYGPLEME